MSNLVEVPLEYVYVTIPAEYICVYHRILAMLADYGEEMLKDCKANCTDKNAGVIECFNMFNAAVAARKLGKLKLAETLIKYIKGRINKIYKGYDNSTSFVFPVDENGQLKAFVSCGERPKFRIDPKDMSLYEYKFNNGFDEHFRLGDEDKIPDEEDNYDKENDDDLPNNDDENNQQDNEEAEFDPDKFVVELRNIHEGRLISHGGYDYYPIEADIYVSYDGVQLDISRMNYQLYVDDQQVIRFNDYVTHENNTYHLQVVVTYNNVVKIAEGDCYIDYHK